MFYLSFSSGTASSISFSTASITTSTAFTNGGLIYAAGTSDYGLTMTSIIATTLSATSGNGGGLYFVNSGTTSITV